MNGTIEFSFIIRFLPVFTFSTKAKYCIQLSIRHNAILCVMYNYFCPDYGPYYKKAKKKV